MGKIVVASSQFFQTNNGDIIKASELTKSSVLFCFNGEDFDDARVLSIRSVDRELNKYVSSHGRILKATSDTTVVKNYNKSIINLETVYTSNFKEINNEIKGTVCSNLPVFGKDSLSSDYIRYLTSSLTYKQNVRPHRGCVKQTIPRYLGKMNKEYLKKILNILFKDSYFKHLDESSKDLLILLCSRLGLAINGITLGHKATKQSGSLKIYNKEQNSTRKECIIPLGSIKEQAYEIETNSETLLVGSILCQI